MTRKIEQLKQKIAAEEKTVASLEVSISASREKMRLMKEQILRIEAKAMVGSSVVLNPRFSYSNQELRKLRGIVGVIKSTRAGTFVVDFGQNRLWRLQFRHVVPATTENVDGDHSGNVADGLADMLNRELNRGYGDRQN